MKTILTILLFTMMLISIIPLGNLPSVLGVPDSNPSLTRAPIDPSHGPPLRAATTGTSGNYWWVGASSTDSSALPNTGVRANIDVTSQSVPGTLSFWISNDLSNNMWGQVGYYLSSSSSTPRAFYQIWNLNTNTIVTTGGAAVTTGSHTFSMYLQSGTVWAFAIDGNVIGSYDMGSNISSSTYPVYALSEESYTNITPFTFSDVKFSSAMQVQKSGVWQGVLTGQAYGTGWGTQGNIQNNNLAVNQIVVSTSLPSLAAGTTLWNGASQTLQPTTISVSSSTNPSTSDQSVTFTTTVSPSTATGTVTFMDGLTTLGTSTLSSGSATLSSSQLSVGSHSITAVYSGDASYSSSTSAVLTQTVNQAVSQTNLSATFTENGLASGTAYSVTVNGIIYSAIAPNSISMTFPSGTSLTYSYQSPIGTSSGTRYLTSSSGTVTSTTTVTASYMQQFYLQVSSQPATGNNKASGTGWYSAGSTVSIVATPGKAYTFSGWSGSGSGSYAGMQNPATVTMNSPISEIANFHK